MKVFLDTLLILMLIHSKVTIYHYVAQISLTLENGQAFDPNQSGYRSDISPGILMSMEVRRNWLASKKLCKIEAINNDTWSFDSMPTNGYNLKVPNQKLPGSQSTDFKFQLLAVKAHWNIPAKHLWSPIGMYFLVTKPQNENQKDWKVAIEKPKKDFFSYFSSLVNTIEHDQFFAKHDVDKNSNPILYFSFCSQKTVLPLRKYFFAGECKSKNKNDCPKQIPFVVAFRDAISTRLELQTQEDDTHIKFSTAGESLELQSFSTEKEKNKLVRFATKNLPKIHNYESVKVTISPALKSSTLLCDSTNPISTSTTTIKGFDGSNDARTFDCPLIRQPRNTTNDPNAGDLYVFDYYLIDAQVFDFASLSIVNYSDDEKININDMIVYGLRDQKKTDVRAIPFAEDNSLWLEINNDEKKIMNSQLVVENISSIEPKKTQGQEELDQNQIQPNEMQQLIDEFRDFVQLCEKTQDLLIKRWSISIKENQAVNFKRKFKVLAMAAESLNDGLNDQMIFIYDFMSEEDDAKIQKNLKNLSEKFKNKGELTEEDSKCKSLLEKLLPQDSQPNESGSKSSFKLFSKLSSIKIYLDKSIEDATFGKLGSAYMRPDNSKDSSPIGIGSQQDEELLDEKLKSLIDPPQTFEQIFTKKFPSFNLLEETLIPLQQFKDNCIQKNTVPSGQSGTDEASEKTATGIESDYESIKTLTHKAMGISREQASWIRPSENAVTEAGVTESKDTKLPLKITFMRKNIEIIQIIDALHEKQKSLYSKLHSVITKLYGFYRVNGQNALEVVDTWQNKTILRPEILNGFNYLDKKVSDLHLFDARAGFKVDEKELAILLEQLDQFLKLESNKKNSNGDVPALSTEWVFGTLLRLNPIIERLFESSNELQKSSDFYRVYSKGSDSLLPLHYGKASLSLRLQNNDEFQLNVISQKESIQPIFIKGKEDSSLELIRLSEDVHAISPEKGLDIYSLKFKETEQIGLGFNGQGDNPLVRFSYKLKLSSSRSDFKSNLVI